MAIKPGLKHFFAVSTAEGWFDRLILINLEKAPGYTARAWNHFFCIYTSRKYNNAGWI
jgi:transposase